MFSALLLAATVFARAEPVVDVPHGRITIEFADYARAAPDGEVIHFIARSAEPVSAYYGKFPVPRLRVEVEPNSRNPRGLFGREFHGRRVVFYLGSAAGADELKDNQILTHEMFHLGFPDLARDYAWIEEGLATYLAHLARARSGQTTEASFWEDAREGFDDAQRHPGDAGLAGEDNYHRMYWGGALFWFTIDLEIRARSGGTRSLDTVTRAILAAGGTNAHKWGLARLSRAVDKAAGFAVFRKWYDHFGMHAGTADLDGDWKSLGIRFDGQKAVLEPGNALRAAMMRDLP